MVSTEKFKGVSKLSLFWLIILIALPNASKASTCDSSSSKTELSCTDGTGFSVANASSTWCSCCISGSAINSEEDCAPFAYLGYGSFSSPCANGGCNQCCRGVGTGEFPSVLSSCSEEGCDKADSTIAVCGLTSACLTSNHEVRWQCIAQYDTDREPGFCPDGYWISGRAKCLKGGGGEIGSCDGGGSSDSWRPCEYVELSERIKYESMDYNPITGDFSMTGVQVGFFKLVRKVVIYAIKRQSSQPDVQMGRIKIKITPGISKFPLKSQPVENAGEVNFVRVKIIGNRVGKGSKSTTGEKSHPYWECSEKSHSGGSGSYTLGHDGAHTCDDPSKAILTYSECQIAASALAGHPVSVSNEYFDGTKGCHVQVPSHVQEGNSWQFNNNMEGKGEPNHVPICRNGE